VITGNGTKASGAKECAVTPATGGMRLAGGGLWEATS
jgi:hypothetical protein